MICKYNPCWYIQNSYVVCNHCFRVHMYATAHMLSSYNTRTGDLTLATHMKDTEF